MIEYKTLGILGSTRGVILSDGSEVVMSKMYQQNTRKWYLWAFLSDSQSRIFGHSGDERYLIKLKVLNTGEVFTQGIPRNPKFRTQREVRVMDLSKIKGLI